MLDRVHDGMDKGGQSAQIQPEGGRSLARDSRVDGITLCAEVRCLPSEVAVGKQRSRADSLAALG